MRNINRIKPLLEEFEKLWLEHPDLRFGQMVFALNEINNYSRDYFYVEDEQWLEWIKNRFIKKNY